jgi:hypothetical protein
MRPPDRKYADDGTEILFVRRWNTLVSALIVEPSVKLVARTVVDYGLADGQGIYPGNERIARETGYRAAAVANAWAVMRGIGMAERVTGSYYDGRRRTADEYELVIPDDWRGFPAYGPNLRRFRCQHCGKAFNPLPGTHVRPNGSVGWYLARMVFCAPPGRAKRTPEEVARKAALKAADTSCFVLWGGARRWEGLGDKAWEAFRRARDDDWPSASEVRAADTKAAGAIPDLRLA